MATRPIHRKSPVIPIVLLLVAAGLLCVLPVAALGHALSLCGRYEVFDRPQPVIAEPLLSVEIPPDVNVYQWTVGHDLAPRPEADKFDWMLRDAPLWSGASVFLIRLVSPQDAFTRSCNNGWLAFPRFNELSQERIAMGGEGNNRYCASPIVEIRTGLNEFCARGEYWSYIVLQKDNVLIAVYENEDDLRHAGTYSNEAIAKLAASIIGR